LHWPLLPYSLPSWNALTFGRRHHRGLVAERLEHALEQVLVAEGQAAEQQRGVRPVGGHEVTLDRLLEVPVDAAEADALLGRDALPGLVEQRLHLRLRHDVEQGAASRLGRGRGRHVGFSGLQLR
jgi:hypothetical protein